MAHLTPARLARLIAAAKAAGAVRVLVRERPGGVDVDVDLIDRAAPTESQSALDDWLRQRRS
jgi:hypothetical protein